MLQATFFQRLGQAILMTIAIAVLNHTLADPVAAQERLCERSPQNALCYNQRSSKATDDRPTQSLQIIKPMLNVASKYERGFNHET